MSRYFESLFRSRFTFHSRQGSSGSTPGKHQCSPEESIKSGSSPVVIPLHPLPTPLPTKDSIMAADGKPAQPSTGTLGISGLWTRHPIIEGVRRNHSLIKVVLDTTTTGTSTSTSTPAATVTPTTPLAAPGAGAGAGAGAAGAGAKSNRTPVEESRMSRDNGRSGAITASAAQELYYSQQELQHLQMQQQQMLQKKILTNRKLLRERGRVGWEELKLLGVDDDVIREVCQDI